MAKKQYNGKIIIKLTENLIIFRLFEDRKSSSKDYLFYIYNEYLNEVKEYMPEEELKKIGEKILSIKELDTNVTKKVASKIRPIIERLVESDILISSLFIFLLRIKMSIDTIASRIYKKGLIRSINEFVNSEGSVAYKLGQYFLNELNYKEIINRMVLNILDNEQQFIKSYSMLLESLKRRNNNIRKVYDDFLVNSTLIFTKNQSFIL